LKRAGQGDGWPNIIKLIWQGNGGIMNNRYLNAVYTHMILDRDYEQLRTGDGVIVFNEETRVLQKYRNGVHYLVELVDGDRFNAASIAAKLGSARQMLLDAKPQQVFHLIIVFVFSGQLDAEMVQAMNSEPVSSNLIRKYFSCFIVNLKERTVNDNERTSLPTDGVDRILKRFLDASNDEYESLPNIGQILAQKAGEYTIKLKTDKPAITYTLIGINVVVWLIFCGLSYFNNIGYGELTAFFGSKISELIVQGQYWRFITPIFLHAGMFHLLINSYSLYVLGQNVEKIYGHYKFLIVYLIAGILGNITSFSLFLTPRVSGVGASGAIFGLLGALLYFGLENPKIFKKYFGYNVFATIILNVAIGFSLAGIIDNFAHLGGLTGGFLAAGIVRLNAPPEKRPGRNLFLLATLALTLAGLYFGFSYWGH
jgi:rhomboid protease GluP